MARKNKHDWEKLIEEAARSGLRVSEEVYLWEFLNDSNIASNNSKSERCFSFFAVLRNQIKMFGSVRGTENAACLESLEQTAREYVENTRFYYQFLIDKYCPFVRAQKDKESISKSKEIDDFLPWFERTKDYGAFCADKRTRVRLATDSLPWRPSGLLHVR